MRPAFEISRTLIYSAINSALPGNGERSSIATATLGGGSGGGPRRASEQIINAELRFGYAVLCVVGVLGRYVYPFVQNDSGHGVCHLTLALVGAEAQGVLAQHLTDASAVNMNKRLNLSVLHWNPPQCS